MKAFCMLDIWKPIPTTIACFKGQEGEVDELYFLMLHHILKSHTFELTTKRID